MTSSVWDVPSPVHSSRDLGEQVSKKMFKGDDDRLLERMIESCQSRPSARLPGYGRQLVPFFAETGDRAGQPLEHSSRCAAVEQVPGEMRSK